METRINRWVKSKDTIPSHGWEDRFIELRIALEVLHLDNYQGELSFRLATNAAWYSGTTPPEREPYHKLLREAYRVSSRAIHGEHVKPAGLNRELLWKVPAECRKEILCVLGTKARRIGARSCSGTRTLFREQEVALHCRRLSLL